MKTLIIVESPTKARTLSKFLGKDFVVTASMGHVRDLPKSKLGVDVEHNFEPQYSVARSKLPTVKDLQAKAKQADRIILASDPDREGEAIAWHVSWLLSHDKLKVKSSKLKINNKKTADAEAQNDKGGTEKAISNGAIEQLNNDRIVRITFHEITEKAIREALEHPGVIDMKLVNAQQGRRILDRLVGYKLSPLLWKKIKKGLSAGRVQSVTVRLIVEREREIEKFKQEEYWTINSKFKILPQGDLPQAKSSRNKDNEFFADLSRIDGKKAEIKTGEQAEDLKKQLFEQQNYSVSSFEEKEVKRSPYPPFTTSTLQQSGSNLFGWAAKRTMQTAQRLYEQGLITYMRTDSVNLNIEAVNEARNFIANLYGKEYLTDSPRIYKTRSKGAQEAHEAIRPTNLNDGGGLLGDEKKLYNLIRDRMLACQMNDAIFTQRSIEISDENNKYTFRGTSSVVKFEGWKKIFGETVKQQDSELVNENDDKENKIPELKVGDGTDLVEILPTQHFTLPPPRYTEASLIKALEELGIGRPSTYAPTISTIQDRYYVEKEDKKLKPTSLGMSVNDFLMKYFADILDYQFTAGVEASLDEIETGDKEWQKVIGDFYFPFEKKLLEIQDTAEKVVLEVETTDEICEKCGKPMIVRIGRFGKFLGCSGFPECHNIKSILKKINLSCPKCGAPVVAKKTKKGRMFFSCSTWPKCDFAAWKKEDVIKAQTGATLAGGSSGPIIESKQE
jgi:DNA topoisomerase I